MLASVQAAGELDGVGGGPAGGELGGESHAAAVRGSAALEAGRGAGGRKPSVHLVDTETDDGIARFRRGPPPAGGGPRPRSRRLGAGRRDDLRPDSSSSGGW